MSTPLTGRRVLAIALGGFGIVIAANMAMLFAATGSFPGLVVKNSYVASQEWNAHVEAQRALGWQARIDLRDGQLEIRLTDRDDNVVTEPSLTVVIGRPAVDTVDRELTLTSTDGIYAASVDLGPGRWLIEARTADGPAYRARTILSIGDS